MNSLIRLRLILTAEQKFDFLMSFIPSLAHSITDIHWIYYLVQSLHNHVIDISAAVLCSTPGDKRAPCSYDSI